MRDDNLSLKNDFPQLKNLVNQMIQRVDILLGLGLSPSLSCLADNRMGNTGPSNHRVGQERRHTWAKKGKGPAQAKAGRLRSRGLPQSPMTDNGKDSPLSSKC